MEGHLSLQERVFRGSFLVCVWASLRFNDAQHVFWDKLILDHVSLRAASFQPNSSKSGYPFAVQCLGLISERPQSSWVLKWLEALNDVWDASISKYGPHFIPDHLFPRLDGSGAVLEPMSYAQTINCLRRYISHFSSLKDFHSAKATLLSWACQLNLDPATLELQGHHKSSLQSSVNLYGRDSVHSPLQLQSDIRTQIIMHGFRPSTPLHRGAQTPVIEPAVTFMSQTQLFDLSCMNLHRFRIPPPPDSIEIVDSPVDHPSNHIPEPELEESPLFITTPKIVHFATWTVQHGLSFRGSKFRPKCGAPIVPDAQVSPELPKEVRFCRRKACLTALHASCLSDEKKSLLTFHSHCLLSKKTHTLGP